MSEEGKEITPGQEQEAAPSRPLPGREPRGKLFGYNWLEGVSDSSDFDIVQVQFKNTRNGFYRNVQNLDLKIGDMVAVDASPGHDIGMVTMVGRLVEKQMKRANLREDDIRKIFRKARKSDLEKYEEAKAREHDTMIRSRKIAEELGLDMKIGDVEYQGDGGKAIFYYIADERVDFRKLIRILADNFKVRIEMKQIGARQEAGRIGGIGPCGRPLCCATWMRHFVSVGTSAARFQDISMNPQKLAGQCAKLKCCLNYEVDAYMESQRKLPSKDIVLETKDGSFHHFKADILKRKVTYSTDKSIAANLVTIDARRAFDVIALNKQGIKPDMLDEAPKAKPEKKEFIEIVGQDSLTRFDKSKKKKKKKPRPKDNPNNPKENNTKESPKENAKEKPSAPRQNADSGSTPSANHTERRPGKQPRPKQRRRPKENPREGEAKSPARNTPKNTANNGGKDNGKENG